MFHVFEGLMLGRHACLMQAFSPNVYGGVVRVQSLSYTSHWSNPNQVLESHSDAILNLNHFQTSAHQNRQQSALPMPPQFTAAFRRTGTVQTKVEVLGSGLWWPVRSFERYFRCGFQLLVFWGWWNPITSIGSLPNWASRGSTSSCRGWVWLSLLIIFVGFLPYLSTSFLVFWFS